MDYPKSVPSVGLVGGKFVDENAATGVQGSLIPSAWGNGVTDELLSVITAAGLVPNEAVNNQLLAAIKAVTPGRLMACRVYTSAGISSYTPTAGTKKIVVEVQAGGGSSGSTAATGAGQIAASSGGSAGAYGKSIYDVSALTFPLTITVGAGGLAPAAGGLPGNAGGASSFGSYLSAPGGLGSVGVGAQTPPVTIGGAASPAAPTGGNIAGAPGQAGSPSIAISVAALISGAGGSSTYGAGGNAKASAGVGTGGSGYGGGGGGSLQAPSGAALPGAPGVNGLVIVWEYA